MVGTFVSTIFMTDADPFIPNEGIEMVFVSRQAAVVHNQPTGVCNGKVYRRDGEVAGIS